MLQTRVIDSVKLAKEVGELNEWEAKAALLVMLEDADRRTDCEECPLLYKHICKPELNMGIRCKQMFLKCALDRTLLL